MKKLKKIFLFIIMFTFIFTLSGCGTKKSINVEDFKKIMEKNGYKVVDSTDQYKEKFTLKKSYIAIDKKKTYQIEFIEFNNLEEAYNIYNINKKIMEDKKENVVSGYINIDGKNYSFYKAISGGKYRALTRIDNTLMYADINQEYSKEASKLIKKIGY